MPQTVEHIDIIDLLQVRGGLIVLTKIDMVDATLADLAVDEIKKHVRGTVLENAEVVRVSSLTGEGIPELKQKLEALALAVEPRTSHGPFRMPIQRVFSLAGIGTVVTGIPVSGSVRPGSEIEILPLGEKVKVRGIHAYGGKVEEAIAGHSTALAVPEAKEAGVHRGMVCAEPGAFTVGDAVDVELALTRRSAPLAHRAPIRFHTGTIEVRGELLLLDRDAARPGDSFVARVELDEELCCAHNDRFLLRLQNPAVTVGGGKVLRLSSSGRYRRRDLGQELAGIVAAGDRPEARIEHELTQAGPEGRAVDDLSRAIELSDSAVVATLAAMPAVELHRRAMRAFLRAHVEAGERELLESVDRMLGKRAAAASVKRAAIRTTKTLPQPLVECVFDRLQAQGRVRSGRQGQVLFLDRLQPLPALQKQQFDRIVAECEQRGFRPPELAELGAVVGLAGDALLSLVDRAQDEGRIDKVGEHFYGASVVRTVLRAIRGNCLGHGEVLDIPALRDQLDTSRKYLIPLLEYVDSLGLTVLRGGVRRLLPSSELNRELAQERPGA
jgi:selenocysteine-specific elongation factor